MAGAGLGGSILFASGSGRDDDYPYDYPDEPGTPEGGQAPPPRQRPGRSGGGGDANGRRRTVQFEPEERYWTDYLRIALPVIGLLLMIGLLWFWAQQIISDDPDTTEPNPTEEIGLVTTITPEPTQPNQAASTPPAQTGQTGQETQTDVAQQQETPPAETTTGEEEQPTSGGDNQTDAADTTDTAEQAPEEAPPAGEIAIDAEVTVTEPLNLRPEPSTAGEPVAELPVGAVLTVIGGPEEAEGYVWWNVVDENGNSGWVVEDYIELSQ